MNEETDTPETLADIIAEMRRFAAFAADRSRTTPAPSLAAEQECHAAKLTKYADRLEAAAKREYAETKAYFEKLHDGPSMICTAKNCAVRNIGLSIAAAPRKFDESAPGNAAAMRGALLKVLGCYESGAIRTEYNDPDSWKHDDELCYLKDDVEAALAAPARNCDVGTAAEQAKRFKLFCDKHARCGSCPFDFIDDIAACPIEWAQMPFASAEGGDHA